MPGSKKSRITIHRRTDDSLLIQWQFPRSSPAGPALLTELSADHTTLKIGTIDYDERGTPTLTPERSDAAFAALGVQAVEARIASALQTFWRSG